MKNWQDVWKRLSQGQHAVVQGRAPIPAPNPRELRLLVVDCAAVSRPGGALEEACRRLQPYQRHTSASRVDIAADRLRAGLRRHLLGEAAPSPQLVRCAAAFNVPAADGEPRLALLLRSVDRADPASLELLSRLMAGDGVPRLPLLLSFDASEPTGSARRLLEDLQRVLPRDAFWQQGAPAEVSPQSAPRSRESWQSLSRPTLRVLRAAATVGNRFESAVIAPLLGLEEQEVLEALQDAVDHDFAIEDRDHGVFRLDAALCESLRQRTLPSLTRVWHERLTQLFGGPPAPEPAPLPAAPTRTAPAPSDADPPPSATPGAESGTAAAPEATDLLVRDTNPDLRWQDPRSAYWWQRLEREFRARNGATAAGAPGDDPEVARAAASATSAGALPIDEPRAAGHAEAAGLWNTACAQHLGAAERAALAGSQPLAIEHATRALDLAHQIADPEQRRRVRIAGLLLVGRARWQSPARGEESSLAAALEPLSECRTLLTDADPAELRADLGCSIANLQYDVGTPAALELALRELTLASQLLLDAGRPLDAARLLNDEAAVWVKLGDPVRAHYLLSRSRDVFSKVLGSYPAAASELAETEHLLARLLLHAAARPGRERDALQLGVEHGRAAEEAYRGSGEALKLGRVWETLARLELRLGHLEAAGRLLDDARQLQLQLGDDVGLARSSAAAADVHAEGGDYPRALELLAESVEANTQKGLCAGLEFNLARLHQLNSKLPAALQGTGSALEQRLKRALSSCS